MLMLPKIFMEYPGEDVKRWMDVDSDEWKLVDDASGKIKKAWKKLGKDIEKAGV